VKNPKKIESEEGYSQIEFKVTEFVGERLIYNKIEDFVICCRANSVRRRNREGEEGCCLTDEFHFHVYFFDNYICVNNIPIYLLFFFPRRNALSNYQ